jgi:hypothetical protein
MARRRSTGWLVAVAAAAAAWLAPAAPAWADAEIFALKPESGPAGCLISVKGKGLKTTRHVLFAVGRTLKEARFDITSDQEVQVVAPDYYRPGAAATVAILTPTDLAVAIPAAVQVVQMRTPGRTVPEPGASFFHVLPGGWVDAAESVALIERGGVVARSSAPGMQLVKRGGALMDFSNPSGIIFFEPWAVFGVARFLSRHPQFEAYIKVPRITASPGVGPFVYQAAPAPDLKAVPAVPPWIGSVVPPAAGAGDVINLRGRGLAHTTEVLFMDDQGKPRAAGFRIISDQQLKVGVPDLEPITGPQLLVVITTEGLTVTIPRNSTIPSGMVPRYPRGAPAVQPTVVSWAAPGSVSQPSGSHLTFAAPGAVIAGAVGGGTFFIQRGAALAMNAGNPQHVYFEPGAMLPQSAAQAPVGQEARAIVPSFFNQPFFVLPGPLFRR